MFFSKSSLDDVVCSILPSDSKIKNRTERSQTEVDFVVENESEVKKLKVFNVCEMKEKRIFKFLETQSLLSECSLPFIYPSKIYQMSVNVMIYERSYYCCDLKSIIYTKCLSLNEISSIIIRLSEILMTVCECDINVSNLKSINIIYENNKMKLIDLYLNELRREEDMRIDDVCYRSPEELSGEESNEKSVIWSIGCILYEMLNKELPFNEENDLNKTLNNIMRCKLNDDIKVDNERMKKILYRMLKVENEDRLSLIEFKKEMIKENEILRDSENNMMINEERKEILYKNDKFIILIPIVYPCEYYLKSEKWWEIRDDLIERYNSKSNEKILSILLMMKLYKNDYSIYNKLKFQIHHQCKRRREECCLDEMVFDIHREWYNDNEEIYINSDYNEEIYIDSDCICFCEEGTNYLFRILKLINQTKLEFYINIPIQSQSLFGLFFSQLSNLQELDLLFCRFTSNFIESFVKSIPVMKKLKYVDLQSNPIGPRGFKLLLPYLHLLINNRNELDLHDMNLNDESMKLLSLELYKYPNIKKIDIRFNNNIHSIGLKSLFSKFPISKIEFDFNEKSSDFSNDKEIKRLMKYCSCSYLHLNDLNINDDFLRCFISLRLNELKEIRKLDLDNKLTSESVEILINNLSSLPNLKYLELNGNGIGDVGMKILSPHLHILNDYGRTFCSKMELSSEGFKYLLDGLKNIHQKIRLDISENNIDSSEIEYLDNYMKENDNIETLLIHENPIGNDGFKLLLNNLNMLIDYCGEINLSNISINDESVKLLLNKLDSIGECNTINLNGNNIKMSGLKSICEKSLEDDKYPFIEMKCSSWTNEELEYYLNYCIKKERSYDYRDYDLSNMNVNDSHISLIKQIDYKELDLSNNKISSKGLKELTDSLSYYSEYISAYGNEIGDEGVEIICKYLDKFVDEYSSSLNISNIEMSERGLKILIERLKKYEGFKELDISGNQLNEEELRLIKENKEVFCKIEELSITIKENINKDELKSFLEIFSLIGRIKLSGIKEEEKRELSKQFFNIE